jgi:deoxyribose-phosphate aldolase
MKKEPGMHESIQTIARMIDHSLLHPQLTDQELTAGCRMALRYQVASVCIKPYAVAMAGEILLTSGVKVGTVIGFPHGGNPLSIKVKETEQALSDGAEELDMVVNIGKVRSEDWNYISAEIQSVNDLVVQKKGILKVIFENDFLTAEHHKIKLCEICTRHAVAYVKTSTGFGYVKQKTGHYDYAGATDPDLILMRNNCSRSILLKAAGKIRSLDDLLRVKKIGVSRVGTTATEVILQEARERGYK